MLAEQTDADSEMSYLRKLEFYLAEVDSIIGQVFLDGSLHFFLVVADYKIREQYTYRVEPSIMDTIRNQRFVPYSEVSITQGLPVYLR